MELEKQTSRTAYSRLIAAVLVVAAVVWFAVDNRQRVRIDWWVADRESRLIYVIIVSAVLGAVADRLIISKLRKR